MPECPHKTISYRGLRYWKCDWCGQQFIPATRDEALRLISEDDKTKEIMAQIDAALAAPHEVQYLTKLEEP